MNLRNQVEFAEAWAQMGKAAQETLNHLRANNFSAVDSPEDVQIVRESLEDLAPDVGRLCDSYAKWLSNRFDAFLAAR